MKIGFVGLGNMGLPMAGNLVRAGHEVAGFDRVAGAVAAHVAAGGRGAGSIADAVTGVELVLTMLPAGRHVAEVMGEVLPRLAAAVLVVDCSTIDVATARAVAAAAAERGIVMLDAPVSGGTAGAVAGTLTFMVGGAAAGFAQGLPVLRAMGRTIVHAGAAGAGQAAKICNNMMLAIAMLGTAEAFVLADGLGLDRQKLFEIASTASGQSWALSSYCPVPGPVPGSPANRAYAPGFAAALMLKDAQLAQAAAADVGAATPLGAHAARLYQALVEAGEGGRDFSAVFPWLSGLARDGTV